MLINVTKKIALEIKLWKKTFYRWELKQKAQAKDKEQEEEHITKSALIHVNKEWERKKKMKLSGT